MPGSSSDNDRNKRNHSDSASRYSRDSYGSGSRSRGSSGRSSSGRSGSSRGSHSNNSGRRSAAPGAGSARKSTRQASGKGSKRTRASKDGGAKSINEINREFTPVNTEFTPGDGEFAPVISEAELAPMGKHANGEHAIAPYTALATADSKDGKPEKEKKPPKVKKKMSRGKKVALTILIVFLTLAAAAVVAGVLYVRNLNANLHTLDSDVAEVLEPVSAMGEPFYVLILGSDTRDPGSDRGRSDTIILARVDTASQKVTLISIPRDTRVEIPGYGTDKINAAYSYGGAALVVKTVNKFAGVSISHVVEVDFSGFKEIVDALGGVTVTVPPNTYYAGVSVPEGKQKLNGKQALVFARCRKTYPTGDYQRADNQRQLIKAIAKQVLSSDVTEMPKIIKSITKAVATDMDVSEIIGLAMDMRGMDTDAIMTAVVPSGPTMINGISYVVVYDSEWKAMMERVDKGEDPNPKQ
ncbi:MAG: LCP family protein [bacterium]|nr:LCP family protein [bacterium]